MPKVTKQKIGKATKPTKLVVVSPSLDEIAMYDLDGKKIAGCNFSKENSRVTGLESISLGNRKILCSSVTRRDPKTNSDDYRTILFNEKLEEIVEYPLSHYELALAKCRVKQKEFLALRTQGEFSDEVIFINKDCKSVSNPIKIGWVNKLITTRRDNIDVLIGSSYKTSYLIAPDSRTVHQIEHRDSWEAVAAPVHGKFIYALWGPGDPGYGMNIRYFDWKLNDRGNWTTEYLGIVQGHQWDLAAIDFKNRSYVALRTDDTIHVFIPDLEKQVAKIICDDGPFYRISVGKHARKQYLFVQQYGLETAVYNDKMRFCGKIPLRHIAVGGYVISLGNTQLIIGETKKGKASVGKLKFQKNDVEWLPLMTLGTEKDRGRIRKIQSFNVRYPDHTTKMLATENLHDSRIQLYKYVGGAFYKDTFLSGRHLQII